MYHSYKGGVDYGNSCIKRRNDDNGADNKRGGIVKMMEYLGADIKNVVVFGDDYNDMDMFCKDWFSIAMGNGCQDLKDMASYVTDTNVNDGIKKACEHFEWI